MGIMRNLSLWVFLAFISCFSMGLPSQARETSDPTSVLVPKFKKLGPVYQIDQVIWSSFSEDVMNHSEAFVFCKKLGASLPNSSQYQRLKELNIDLNIMETLRNVKALDHLRRSWTLSLDPTSDRTALKAYALEWDTKNLSPTNRLKRARVQCVQSAADFESSELIRGVHPTLDPMRTGVSAPLLRKQLGITLLKPDLWSTSPDGETLLAPPIFNAKFATLGDMYRVGNLIWSGIANTKMNQMRARRFCQQILQARLPTSDEFLSLAQTMGGPHYYQSALIPGLKGKCLWTSNSSDSMMGEYFDGNFGYIEYYYSTSQQHVICVKEANENP